MGPFPCESLANHTKDLSSYVKSLNPGILIHYNIKGVYCFNRYWTNAVYHPLFAGQVDELSFDTGGYEARMDRKAGALVSQIRSYKVARRLKASCEEHVEDELRAAVHMAFGFRTPVAGTRARPRLRRADRLYSHARVLPRVQRPLLPETELVADVAVLRNWPSMAYSISSTYVPTTLMEQVLIQHKVPFDLVFDEQLDSAGGYRALILAGQESISNAQVEWLLNYARKGGTLILAGNCGQYNEWRERRHVHPLLPARREGNGRIVFIPHIVPGSSHPGEADVADQNPKPGASKRRASP